MSHFYKFCAHVKRECFTGLENFAEHDALSKLATSTRVCLSFFRLKSFAELHSAVNDTFIASDQTFGFISPTVNTHRKTTMPQQAGARSSQRNGPVMDSFVQESELV